MLDANLLRIMRVRQDFMALRPMLTPASLDLLTKTMLDAYEKYFGKFSEHTEIDWEVFIPRFFDWHKALKEEEKQQFISIIRSATKPVDECTRNGIMHDLQEIGLATKLANLAEEFDAGDLPDFVEQVSASLDTYKLNVGAKLAEWIDDPIEDLLADEMNEAGIKWRLNTLNKSMRPLRPGDFGIIAARPDKGKTTFLTSEATFFAPQIPEDRNILWLNNEGLGKRIVPRLYQSALGADMATMLKLSKSKQLVDKYRSAVGNRLDKIRVMDVHGMHINQIEAAIEQANAEVVIFDMIDNIRGFGGEARTDLMLEKMYQRVRELAVKHLCICLATSQISNDGDGEMFPTLGMLKDSKTGKQGACDFQLMIGASNDVNFTNSRFMGLPKNKLRTAFGPGDPRAEVIFNPMTARYLDLPEEGTPDDEAHG